MYLFDAPDNPILDDRLVANVEITASKSLISSPITEDLVLLIVFSSNAAIVSNVAPSSAVSYFVFVASVSICNPVY